jgi:catalase
VKINGADPDFHRRDLWERSRRATSPSGSWACRSSPRSRPSKFSFDVLDATKIVPEELVPLRRSAAWC